MKSPQDDRLLELAARISDGERVDWSEIEAMGLDTDQLRLARHLRTVAGIASAQDAPGDSPPLAEGGIEGKWGRLVILERVGGGAYGQVLRAWDPQLEREVALKLLLPRQDEDDRREQDQFLQEARLLARISDPNVATVYGAEIHDGQAGLWMEYVRGRTLQEIIEEQGPRSAGEAVVMGMEVCRAAAMVHQKGVVHRDIKAQNIIRGEGGRIVLTDFGSGYKMPPPGSGDKAFAVSGTPLYMAPEVLKGEEPTPQSDIYSIGVLLYFLLTGTYPVSGGDLKEIRRQHRQGSRRRLSELRPQLPHSICRIVEKALDPNPKKRFKSARQMEDSLASAMTDQSLAQVLASSGARFPSMTRRAILTWAAALTALLAVSLLLVLNLTTPAPQMRVVLELIEGPQSVASVREPLREFFDASSQFQWLGPPELDKALALMREEQTDVVDHDLAQKLLERRFAQVAVRIRVVPRSDEWEILLSASATAPVSRFHSDSVRIRHLGDLDSLIIEMLRPMLSKAVSRSGEIPLEPFPKVTTASFQALIYYTEGLAAATEALSSTVAKLKAAISEDPRFASAYLELARYQSALGNSKASYESIEKAHGMLKGLSLLERELIKVEFQQRRGQHYSAIETAKEAAAQLPDDAHHFYLRLASDQVRVGEFSQAIDYLQEAAVIDPAGSFDYRKRIAFIMTRNGQHEEALRLISDLKSREPFDPYLMWAESAARIGLRQFDEARQVLDSLENGDYGADFRRENRPFYESTAIYYRGQMALLRGHHREALQLYERGRTAGFKYNNGFLDYLGALRLAHIYFLSEEDQAAFLALNHLLDDDFPPHFHFMLRDAALLLSLWGHWDEAAPFVEKLREFNRLYPGRLSDSYLVQLRIEAALQEGRIDDAVKEIGLAEPSLVDIPSLWSVARTLGCDGDFEFAARRYERILARKSEFIHWLSPDFLAIIMMSAERCLVRLERTEEAAQLRTELEAFWQPDQLGRSIRIPGCPG